MEHPDIKNNSIDKALTILSTFLPNNKEMGTIEISRKLGFHKATVSRILLNLKKHGYLQQNFKTKKFTLGPSILKLALSIHRSLNNNIVHFAKPYIDDLREKTSEMAATAASVFIDLIHRSEPFLFFFIVAFIGSFLVIVTLSAFL